MLRWFFGLPLLLFSAISITAGVFALILTGFSLLSIVVCLWGISSGFAIGYGGVLILRD
jgi:hypothetical protein